MSPHHPPGTLTHIVLVRWREDAPASVRNELATIADAFPVLIPGVIDVSYGPSVSPEGLEGGFEWALVVTFADAEARDGYLPHPAHAPASDLIGAWSEHVVVFDVCS